MITMPINKLKLLFLVGLIIHQADLQPQQAILPGDDVVDILATDVYTENFNKKNYDQLLSLAKSKPIALGEVGKLPPVEILKAQTRWTWFMLWVDPSGLFTDIKSARTIYEC
jgi:mannan endo-1,4-beta-mannosidase